MATGILYTLDDMVSKTLKLAFSAHFREGKLYHFSHLSHLAQELVELEAKFILLDTKNLPPLSQKQKRQLIDTNIPVFCLGENAPVGLPLPRPFNPHHLMLQMDGVSDPLREGVDILEKPGRKPL